MLVHQKVSPNKIGIDKPSQKFLNFMKKHYKLSRYQEQNNNFVIFDNYFDASWRYERPMGPDNSKLGLEKNNPSEQIQKPVNQEKHIEKTPVNNTPKHDNVFPK